MEKRTWAEIDLDAIAHNMREIRKITNPDAQIMAVVKADAYGHGFLEVTKALLENGADRLAVAMLQEAKQLRSRGVNVPILLLGASMDNDIEDIINFDVTPNVFSYEFAKAISYVAEKKEKVTKIHIKLDTGMSRIGFDCRDNSLSGTDDAIAAARLPGFDFGGIFTHFAVSDRTPQEEDGFTAAQYSRFIAAKERFIKAGLTPKICHCCNSAAFCLDTDKHLDMCRPGIILYGLTPSSGLKLKEDFIPAMTVKSVVSMVKTVKKGDTVCYGRTFTAEREMKTATVTAGYADGYPRLLSNKGYVLIKGKKAPIIGRICMDQMSVDVTDIEDVKQGDEVILFGKELPVEELADMCGTINYEIICGISPRVPRIIIKNSAI